MNKSEDGAAARKKGSHLYLLSNASRKASPELSRFYASMYLKTAGEYQQVPVLPQPNQLPSYECETLCQKCGSLLWKPQVKSCFNARIQRGWRLKKGGALAKIASKCEERGLRSLTKREKRLLVRAKNSHRIVITCLVCANKERFFLTGHARKPSKSKDAKKNMDKGKKKDGGKKAKDKRNKRVTIEEPEEVEVKTSLLGRVSAVIELSRVEAKGRRHKAKTAPKGANLKHLLKESERQGKSEDSNSCLKLFLMST